MSELAPTAPSLPDDSGPQTSVELPPPAGPRWRPDVWIKLIVWQWKQAGPVEATERRGYWFWLPTIALILAIELLGALSQAFDNWIPWPTISDTIGHLERRWDWVAVIVIALITMTAFHVLAYRGDRAEGGRALRQLGAQPTELGWYNWLFVACVTAAAIVLAIAAGASKYEYGYVIYGVLAGLGILAPSVLSFGFHKLAGFPTLFFTIAKLRRRLHLLALVLVTGLAVLAVHLAFYPWPDITHESASFAGLNPAAARTKAERELRKLRPNKPPLNYSTQTRGVRDGGDAWYVYFQPGCVMIVTKDAATPSPECSR